MSERKDLGRIDLEEASALESEIKRLRGWPEIKVGAQSPPHSPVDRYRCENEDCEIESVWEFRPDDHDLDESVVNCPACGEEGELFFRWFRGGTETPDGYRRCPRCDGKGKHDGPRFLEDPCLACHGDGLIASQYQVDSIDAGADPPDAPQADPPLGYVGPTGSGASE